MIPTIKYPQQMTIANWYNEYPDFNKIFQTTTASHYTDMLKPDVTYEILFDRLLKTQGSRVVTPPMTFKPDKDAITIGKIKIAIAEHAYLISLKYELLAESLPDNLDDYYENYQMSRQKTRKKEVKQGTITNSGSDTTFNNVHSTTTKSTSTGETTAPRFESSNETSTGLTDTANNSVKMQYGRTITSNPGDEDITERTTAHGYYNSGTKADMIREVRDLLNYNLVDEWIKEILPTFCCSYYNPVWSVPSEFIL